jgi:hypothetical protein
MYSVSSLPNAWVLAPTNHTSAMLDVQSANKGLLIPRMTGTQRNNVVSLPGLWKGKVLFLNVE